MIEQLKSFFGSVAFPTKVDIVRMEGLSMESISSTEPSTEGTQLFHAAKIVRSIHVEIKASIPWPLPF